MSRSRYWIIVFILAATGLSLARLSHGHFTPARRELSTFPKQVGRYSAVREIPIEADVRAILGSGDFLERIYQPFQGGAPVVLYMGYYPRQENGNTVHSPQHCLPGTGWEALDIREHDVNLGDGHVLRTNRYIVQKEADRQMVFYWFQAHGRSTPSEYWSKFYLVRDAMVMNRTDGAVIRLSAPVVGSETETERALNAFAREISGLTNEFIPN